MTAPVGARTFVVMTNARCTFNILVPLAFSAAISLMLGQLVNLSIQLFGSGGISALPLIGDLAGIAGCALSIWVGCRWISRGHRH
jgi:hypothetical protein